MRWGRVAASTGPLASRAVAHEAMLAAPDRRAAISGRPPEPDRPGRGRRFASRAIATWNVNSLKARMPRVERVARRGAARRRCACRRRSGRRQFPALTFQALGYESVHHGQGQWNGVAILSTVGIEDVLYGFDDGREPDADARIALGHLRRGAGRHRSTSRTVGRSTTTTTTTSSPGWRGCGPPRRHHSTRRAAGDRRRLEHRPRRTATCGTRRRSRAPPT